MQKPQQLRTQFLSTIMTAVVCVGFSSAVMAAGVGVGVNAGVGVDAGVGADARVGASGAAQAGGTADGYMSPSGSDNNNAQWKSGAARGMDRATERMNPNGTVPEAGLEATGMATGTAAVKGKRSGTR